MKTSVLCRNAGDHVNALGFQSANLNIGANVNAFGVYAAASNWGPNTNAFGASAAQNNSGEHVNAIGQSAAGNNSGFNVNAIGNESAMNNNGDHVVAIGFRALMGSDTVSEGLGNIGVGYQAGMNIGSGEKNIAIGFDVQVPDADESNQINIGNSIIRESNGVIRMKDLIRLTPTTAPATPEAGMIYFSSSDNKLYCFDGTIWQALW